MRYRLHDYGRSSSAWRVRIGLNLKELEVEHVHVDVSRAVRAQDLPEYGSVNPMRQVPVLEWKEQGRVHRVTQSVAILEYLEQRHPSPALLPASGPERAHVREMVELVNAGIQPLQNNRVIARVDELGGDGQAWAAHFVARGLSALEALARPGAGAFLFGDDVTLADLFLVPQLFNARRFGVAVDGLSTLLRAEASAMQLDAFRRAHPDDHDPDRAPKTE